MGLFHYLLIIKLENPMNQEEISNFFYQNQFINVEKTDKYISLIFEKFVGKIEVFIDNNKEFSIRTDIHNQVEIINDIIFILKKFSAQMNNKITVCDIQNKKKLKLTEIDELNVLYLKRRKYLENFLT